MQTMHCSHISHLQSVAINEYLGYKWTSDVNVFDLFRCNVFALSQLKDVLLAINNLQTAILQCKYLISISELHVPLSFPASFNTKKQLLHTITEILNDREITLSLSAQNFMNF